MKPWKLETLDQQRGRGFAASETLSLFCGKGQLLALFGLSPPECLQVLHDFDGDDHTTAVCDDDTCHLDGEFTVSEMIRCRAALCGTDEYIDELVNMFELDMLLHVRCCHLEVVQRRLVQVVMACIVGVTYLYIPHPLIGLSYKDGASLMDKLALCARKFGLGIVVTTNRASTLLNKASNILLAKNGERVFFGPPSLVGPYFERLHFTLPKTDPLPFFANKVLHSSYRKPAVKTRSPSEPLPVIVEDDVPLEDIIDDEEVAALPRFKDSVLVTKARKAKENRKGSKKKQTKDILPIVTTKKKKNNMNKKSKGSIRKNANKKKKPVPDENKEDEEEEEEEESLSMSSPTPDQRPNRFQKHRVDDIEEEEEKEEEVEEEEEEEEDQEEDELYEESWSAESGADNTGLYLHGGGGHDAAADDDDADTDSDDDADASTDQSETLMEVSYSERDEDQDNDDDDDVGKAVRMAVQATPRDHDQHNIDKNVKNDKASNKDEVKVSNPLDLLGQFRQGYRKEYDERKQRSVLEEAFDGLDVHKKSFSRVFETTQLAKVSLEMGPDSNITCVELLLQGHEEAVRNQAVSIASAYDPEDARGGTNSSHEMIFHRPAGCCKAFAVLQGREFFAMYRTYTGMYQTLIVSVLLQAVVACVYRDGLTSMYPQALTFMALMVAITASFKGKYIHASIQRSRSEYPLMYSGFTSLVPHIVSDLVFAFISVLGALIVYAVLGLRWDINTIVYVYCNLVVVYMTAAALCRLVVTKFGPLQEPVVVGILLALWYPCAGLFTTEDNVSFMDDASFLSQSASGLIREALRMSFSASSRRQGWIAIVATFAGCHLVTLLLQWYRYFNRHENHVLAMDAAKHAASALPAYGYHQKVVESHMVSVEARIPSVFRLREGTVNNQTFRGLDSGFVVQFRNFLRGSVSDQLKDGDIMGVVCCEGHPEQTVIKLLQDLCGDARSPECLHATVWIGGRVLRAGDVRLVQRAEDLHIVTDIQTALEEQVQLHRAGEFCTKESIHDSVTNLIASLGVNADLKLKDADHTQRCLFSLAMSLVSQPRLLLLDLTAVPDAQLILHKLQKICVVAHMCVVAAIDPFDSVAQLHIDKLLVLAGNPRPDALDGTNNFSSGSARGRSDSSSSSSSSSSRNNDDNNKQRKSSKRVKRKRSREQQEIVTVVYSGVPLPVHNIVDAKDKYIDLTKRAQAKSTSKDASRQRRHVEPLPMLDAKNWFDEFKILLGHDRIVWWRKSSLFTTQFVWLLLWGWFMGFHGNDEYETVAGLLFYSVLAVTFTSFALVLGLRDATPRATRLYDSSYCSASAFVCGSTFGTIFFHAFVSLYLALLVHYLSTLDGSGVFFGFTILVTSYTWEGFARLVAAISSHYSFSTMLTWHVSLFLLLISLLFSGYFATMVESSVFLEELNPNYYLLQALLLNAMEDDPMARQRVGDDYRVYPDTQDKTSFLVVGLAYAVSFRIVLFLFLHGTFRGLQNAHQPLFPKHVKQQQQQQQPVAGTQNANEHKDETAQDDKPEEEEQQQQQEEQQEEKEEKEEEKAMHKMPHSSSAHTIQMMKHRLNLTWSKRKLDVNDDLDSLHIE